MKIKRFNNIWTMGLIIFGVMLLALYIVKIFCPEYIIGVAEVPSIVKFGEYVDTHKWAYYLFYSITSFVAMYFYLCACCRVTKLKWLDIFILFVFIALSHLVERFLPNQSLVFNFLSYIVLPLIIVAINKIRNFNVFYSTCICVIITSMAQGISLAIRDISTMITYPNTATYFILLIDGYIWNILLYNFFNFKKKEG